MRNLAMLLKVRLPRSWIVLALLVFGTSLAYAADGQSSLVERGHHLALIGDCAGCHTPKGGPEFSGNKQMNSPFGSFYTANITQDKQTGIGNWTYADFKRALHQGISKDGSYIYPAMPFVSYTQISDDDVKALWAYFQTIQPVHHEVRPPDLMIIGSTLHHFARNALLGWRLPFFDAGRFQPTPGRSEEYNRGAYYVQALGHCSSCHTPRNIAFAQKDDQFLNGFTLNGWYAPRISPGPDSAIRDWNVDQLAHFLKDGDLGTKSAAVGPMMEVWHDSLRHLPYADLHAMAVYLKTMPRSKDQGPKVEKVAITSQDASLGHTVYDLHCQTCHGAHGEGTYGVAPALAGNNLAFADDANSVVMSVVEGFDPRGVWGAMPSFGTTLSNKEIAAVSNYVRTAWNNNASADATESMVASSRDHAQADGDMPPNGQRRAVVCPSLPADVIKPALQPGDTALLASYDNQAQLAQIVAGYKSARANAPSGDAVKALTSAYCRALVKNPKVTDAERDNRIFQYAQKVAKVAAGS